MQGTKVWDAEGMDSSMEAADGWIKRNYFAWTVGRRPSSKFSRQRTCVFPWCNGRSAQLSRLNPLSLRNLCRVYVEVECRPNILLSTELRWICIKLQAEPSNHKESGSPHPNAWSSQERGSRVALNCIKIPSRTSLFILCKPDLQVYVVSAIQQR
jgi:hypothetical protein